MTYDCWICDKVYTYNKSFNKHLYQKHPVEMKKIEDEPIDITPTIFSVKAMKVFNKEAQQLIKDDLRWGEIKMTPIDNISFGLIGGKFELKLSITQRIMGYVRLISHLIWEVLKR